PGLERLTAALLNLYSNDPDAGVHAAAEWTLRRWHQETALAEAQSHFRAAGRDPCHRWYVSPQALAWAVIEPPGEFVMGSPPHEPGRREHEPAPRRLIPRRYAIAVKEITVGQFAAFLEEDNDPERRKRFRDRPPGDPALPRNGLSWYDAAAFC